CYVPIIHGCDLMCTFCIIPKVRGSSRSRPLSEILDEARRLVDAGYQEIALTGVNTGLYGEDLKDEVHLVDVVKGLERISGLQRIRLNSLEPRCVTDELIDFAADSEKVCRHFHIPLQSGDDNILKGMGRRYRTRYYADLIEKIDRKIKDACFGADVMVGFQGEGETQFENTFHFIDNLPLTYLHVFTYSEREGTPAVRMKGRVPPRLKGERSLRLRELSKKKREEFHKRFIRQTVKVLVEGKEVDETFSGLTDNYIRVRLKGKKEWVNEMVPIRITQVKGEAVFGEAVQ
ncbi:MiaB/RimO family radical SAM methylthiotransferase, partial [candidate division TA06 bacterium]|nr:MiaB/RimO family radical SAM methylthiotransferase [candidate division TA06 bacterium]